MATQSLVDFQTQLMKRLQSAESAGNVASWLAIEVLGHKYLLPLVEAGEVVLLSSITQIEPVTHTQPWFVGVVNLRGAPYALIDIAGWLGLREGKPDLGYMARHTASVIAFNPSLEMSCALLVDKLAGLRNDSDWTAATPPTGADPSAQYLADRQGQVWQVMRLSDLARDEYFLSIEVA